MTTSKQQYQSVLDSIQPLEDQLDLSVALLTSLEDGSEVFPNTSEIYAQIGNVKSWASRKIGEIELMESFLTSFKALFTEYGAKIEIVEGNTEIGYGSVYGESYGGAQTEGNSLALKVSIEKDGLTGEKVYASLPLVAENI
jgi:hypothetical protein